MKYLPLFFLLLVMIGCTAHHDQTTLNSGQTSQEPSRESYLGPDGDPYRSGAFGYGAEKD